MFVRLLSQLYLCSFISIVLFQMLSIHDLQYILFSFLSLFIFILLSWESDGGAVLWTNPHLLKTYPVSKFFDCCLKSCPYNLLLASVPPSRDKYRKVSYPRTLQRDEGKGCTKTSQFWSPQKRCLKPSATLPTSVCLILSK